MYIEKLTHFHMVASTATWFQVAIFRVLPLIPLLRRGESVLSRVHPIAPPVHPSRLGIADWIMTSTTAQSHLPSQHAKEANPCHDSSPHFRRRRSNKSEKRKAKLETFGWDRTRPFFNLLVSAVLVEFRPPRREIRLTKRNAE